MQHVRVHREERRLLPKAEAMRRPDRRPGFPWRKEEPLPRSMPREGNDGGNYSSRRLTDLHYVQSCWPETIPNLRGNRFSSRCRENFALSGAQTLYAHVVPLLKSG